MIDQYIKDNSLRIIVRANASKTEIVGWDNSRKALRISVRAAAEKGKANKEIIKFFSRLLKKRIFIASGLTSREKLLKIE